MSKELEALDRQWKLIQKLSKEKYGTNCIFSTDIDLIKQALTDKDNRIEKLDKENSALKGTTISEKVRNCTAMYKNENGVLMIRCTFKEHYTMAVQQDAIREIIDSGKHDSELADKEHALKYYKIVSILKESE